MTDPLTSPETRTTLIRGVCAHDPHSWREFVHLYDSLLQAYIGSCEQRCQLGLDDHDREDIKQEVLIKLYHKLPTFQTHMRFRSWLWTVTRNVVIDWVRQQRGRGKGARSVAGRPRKVPLTPHLEDSLTTPDADALDQALISAHDRQLLLHVLEKVKTEMSSANKWTCFELHYLNGEPSSSVAEKLGISVSLVNTNTSRVRARIREWCAYYEVDL